MLESPQFNLYPPTPDISPQRKFFICKSCPLPVLSTHTGFSFICSLVRPNAEYLAIIPGIDGKGATPPPPLNLLKGIALIFPIKFIADSFPLDTYTQRSCRCSVFQNLLYHVHEWHSYICTHFRFRNGIFHST